MDKSFSAGFAILILIVLGILLTGLPEDTKIMESCSGFEDKNTLNCSTSEPMAMDNMMMEEMGVQFSRITENLDKIEETEILDLEDKQTIELRASMIRNILAGNEIKLFGYNKQIPGPLLKVSKGDTIKVKFINDLDVETTVHWHGVRIENAFDGTPGLTQDPVQPGEIFVYEVHVPDEGIYWYHPHVREDYQQDLGLYGNLYVESDYQNYYSEVNKEEFIILDDFLMAANDVYPFYEDYTNHALMGRFGNIMLINGKTSYSLVVSRRETVRFFITNVANTRTFNISILGAKIKLVGTDISSFQKEEFVDSVIISPAERYIIEVLFEEPGVYELKHINPKQEYVLGRIKVSNEGVQKDFSNSFSKLNTNFYVEDDIEDFKEHFEKEVDVNLKLTLEMDMNTEGMDHNMNSMENMDHAHTKEEAMNPDHHENDHDEIEWEDDMPEMNTKSTSEVVKWIIKDMKTGKENMDIEYNWKVGDVVKVRIFNDPDSMHPMNHPIHFHGQRFLVLSENGVKNKNMAWKDTVLVPNGYTTDLLLELSNPGKWMGHCHIAEHLSSGMMFVFNVE